MVENENWLPHIYTHNICISYVKTLSGDVAQQQNAFLAHKRPWAQPGGGGSCGGSHFEKKKEVLGLISSKTHTNTQTDTQTYLKNKGQHRQGLKADMLLAGGASEGACWAASSHPLGWPESQITRAGECQSWDPWTLVMTWKLEQHWTQPAASQNS